ncbi:MAG: epoxyqueuosine reductase QueH [Eggerthellaceae bacterium]
MNIAPADEYARRLATLRAWADEQVPVVEALTTRRLGGERGTRRRGGARPVRREARCRACYRCAEEAAALAAEQGFDAWVPRCSPTIHRRHPRGVERSSPRVRRCRGYRPFYDEATHRSRA